MSFKNPIFTIDNLKRPNEKVKDSLIKENSVLKDRCRALTHGNYCMLCPYDCKNRTMPFEKDKRDDKR